MPSQVAVSTYFFLFCCCDPVWDLGLVFFETLLEATWDDCHCLVIRLSLVFHGFIGPVFAFSPCFPLFIGTSGELLRAFSSSMLLHKFFFDPYDLNDLFPSPIKGWVPFRDITGVFRALTLPFWFPFSRPLL